MGNCGVHCQQSAMLARSSEGKFSEQGQSGLGF